MIVKPCLLKIKEIELINEGDFKGLDLVWKFDKGKLIIKAIKDKNEFTFKNRYQKINTAYRDYGDFI